MSSAPEVPLYAHLRALQAQVRDQLCALPGITGSAIARKVVSGRETDDIALVILVEEKKALPDSDPAMVLLKRIHNEGYLTDVVVQKHGAVPIPPLIQPHEALEAKRTDKTDPMIGGLSVGADVNVIRDGSAGTLGIAVTRSGGSLGILSNAHVFFYDKSISTVCQPARVDSWRNYQAGKDLAVCDGNVSLGGTQTYVDCGVATVIDGRSATLKKIFDLPDVTGIVPHGQVAIGDKVKKSGLVTNITVGTVKSVSQDGGPNGKQPNQFAVVGDNGKPFAEPGDSGSVVMRGTEIIGLLWGENTDDKNVKVALVSPIEAVLSALSITI